MEVNVTGSGNTYLEYQLNVLFFFLLSFCFPCLFHSSCVPLSLCLSLYMRYVSSLHHIGPKWKAAISCRDLMQPRERVLAFLTLLKGSSWDIR